MSANDWWFIDLAGIVAFAGVASFGLFNGGSGVVRIVLAAPFVLFVPGYAIVSALFPDRVTDDSSSFDEHKTGLRNPLSTGPGIDPIERFVLSIVLSIATVSTVALATTITPWGITMRPILAGVVLTTIVFALLAIVTRVRCPAADRYTPSIPSSILFSRRGRSAYDGTNVRLFNVALLCSVAILLVSGGYAIANPPQHEGYTEFSVETENVTAETETMYRATYERDQPQELTVTIGNEEHRDVTYTSVVLLQRVEYADDGETADVLEEDELTRDSVTLEDGDSHAQALEVAPTMSGDDLRLVVLLYDGEVPDQPSTENAYRVIRLPIEVS